MPAAPHGEERVTALERAAQAGTDRCDALVIGGGPAGLSAAIYLARACRTVAVFDCGRPGRSDWAQINHNYLGFPDGISIVELCERGRRQAERFGVRFHDAEVHVLAAEDDGFRATGPDMSLGGRAVVLATGVSDRWPTFPGYEEFIGRSLHWCIVCDGFEMQGQRVIVAGNDASAAELALQMRGFAASVTLVTNSVTHDIPDAAARELAKADIAVVQDRIAGARARDKGVIERVVLESGYELPVDHLFNARGATPNSGLARSVGVALSPDGYIAVDTEAKTNVPGVYAAGDVTRLFSHQVLTAAHEGATAACALDYFLYEQDRFASRAGALPVAPARIEQDRRT